MFGKRKETEGPNHIASLIGAGTRIEGGVRFSGGLRVDGEISGDVVGSAESSLLVLSEHARVEGDVCVRRLVLNGQIVGDVVVLESVELQSKARIVGNLSYRLIELHQGAMVEGRLIRLPEQASLSQ